MGNTQENTKEVFCSKCQAVTTHKGSVDANGEFLFECLAVMVDNGDGKEVSHHFVKFPADTDPTTFKQLIVKHEEVNTGQVSVEEQEKKLAELLAGPNEPTPPETPVDDTAQPQA